jgi:hypothetical protein
LDRSLWNAVNVATIIFLLVAVKLLNSSPLQK